MQHSEPLRGPTLRAKTVSIKGDAHDLPASRILVKPKETARQLDVNEHTLAVWRCTGRYPELAYVRVGRHIRYTQVAIDAFIQSRTIGSCSTDMSA